MAEMRRWVAVQAILNPMKELFRSRRNPPSARAGKPSVANKSNSDKNEVGAFLAKLAAMPKTAGDARLIFALDATSSREFTWDLASGQQAEMFQATRELGGLNVQLCHFRGFGEFYASDWHTDGRRLLDVMTGIRCRAGTTQIARLLKHVLAENRRKRVKAVVYVGDAVEESIDRLGHVAGQLGVLQVPLFMFHEGHDQGARRAFEELARLSGGACCRFDAGSAGQLRELLKAVAVFAAGGLAALRDLSKRSGQGVKLLERQLR